MPKIVKSDLPFGSEFSPSQISLREVLQFANQHGGDWKAFENAVYERYFKGNKTSEYNRRKLANNTKLGMIAYGIIDRDAKLTEFGGKLLACPDDKPLFETLARHSNYGCYEHSQIRFHAEDMDCYRVSPLVNNAKNDSPECLTSV